MSFNNVPVVCDYNPRVHRIMSSVPRSLRMPVNTSTASEKWLIFQDYVSPWVGVLYTFILSQLECV